MNQPASIGHNLPPSDTELLAGRLEESNNDLTARHLELMDAISRLPPICENAETAKKLTAFGIQIKDCADKLEARRVLEKKPYDNLAATVQNFFKFRIDDLMGTNGALKKVTVVLKAYKDKEDKRIADEAAAERIRLEQEAAVRRDAAQKLLNDAAMLEAQGRHASSSVVLQRAQEAETSAQEAEAVVSAPIKAAPSIIRAETGGSVSTTARWKAEIISVKDLDLEALRDYIDRASLDKALNAFKTAKTKQIKPTDPAPEIKGARIFRDSNIQFRS